MQYRGYDLGEGTSAFTRTYAAIYNFPQLDFPSFDGTNPKIWIKRCETFFGVYAIPVEQWVKFATMCFSGSAAFWMQSIEVDVKKLSWASLCQAVVDRFERNQYNHVPEYMKFLMS